MRAGVTSIFFSAKRAVGVLARLGDLDAAHGKRIDHHDGATGRGGEDGDARRPRAHGTDRRAPHQRQCLDQSFEAFDARDATIGEERARYVVLARERASVGHRQFARGRGAAELVGNDRLAAFRRAEREVAQRGRIADAFEKQQVAVDIGIIEGRGADLADREIDLIADRHEPREADAACLPARHQRADHGAGVRGKEGAPDRNVRLGEGCVGGEQQALAQVDHAQARRTDNADPGFGRDLAQPVFTCEPVGAGFRETGRQDGRDLDARPAAFRDGVDHGVGRYQNVGVVRRFGQRRDRRVGALAQHRLAPCVDAIDFARIARFAQEFQRPAGGFRRVVRLADDRDRAW